jgi:hypothetical protein
LTKTGLHVDFTFREEHIDVGDCILQDELLIFFSLLRFLFVFDTGQVVNFALRGGVVLTGKFLSEKWLTDLCGGLLGVA